MDKSQCEIQVHQVELLADELMKSMRYLEKLSIERWNMLHPSLPFYNGFSCIPST